MNRETLLQLFRCDPEVGILYWLPRDRSQFTNDGTFKSWNTRFANQIAGSINKRGYCDINVNGTLYHRHRLIWLFVKGVMPDRIDHIHGVVAGDGIENLRDVTQAVNVKNLSRQKRNTSGCTGVDWYAPSGKWRATIRSNGQRFHLGHFNNIEDAIAARKSAERAHGFHENHGRAA